LESRLIVMALAMLMCALPAHGKSKPHKPDWFFNPKCQAKVIWSATAKHEDTEEVRVCRVMQLPSGIWVPRYDVNADKNYVETEVDRRLYLPLDVTLVDKLLVSYGYPPTTSATHEQTK
jgi:hypothetical protein